MLQTPIKFSICQVLIDTWWNVNYVVHYAYILIVFVLIDTWWNVNQFIVRQFSLIISFNRYMVECEFCHILYSGINLFCFNRYMVECEFYLLNYVFLFYQVLIDTWWNVNAERRSMYPRTFAVLIDTWWNVNSIFVDTVDWGWFGFNRYMVECE